MFWSRSLTKPTGPEVFDVLKSKSYKAGAEVTVPPDSVIFIAYFGDFRERTLFIFGGTSWKDLVYFWEVNCQFLEDLEYFGAFTGIDTFVAGELYLFIEGIVYLYLVIIYILIFDMWKIPIYSRVWTLSCLIYKTHLLAAAKTQRGNCHF